MASLNIEGLSIHEEGFYFEVDEDGKEAYDLRWCLVGRFLSDRSIHVKSMKARVANMWRPVTRFTIKESKRGLFLLHFDRKLDMESAIHGGPWTFDDNPLIIERVQLVFSALSAGY